jgi:hypothetical protein
MADDERADDEPTAESPGVIHGFVDAEGVLDSYRGPGTNTVRGAALVLKLHGPPPRKLILALSPYEMTKLIDGLAEVVARQERSDRAGGIRAEGDAGSETG